MSETMSIQVRYYLSLNHMQAAAYLARLGKQIERTPGWNSLPAPDQQTVFADYRACAIGSILSSVCFLEAAINELFADAVHHSGEWLKPLGTDLLRMLASVWSVEKFERGARLLERFEVALSLAGKPAFQRGMRPCQDVRDLIELRNALVHAKPDWVTTVSESDPAAVDEQQLQKVLRAKNFALNPFLTGPANPFFPDKCLSHGCAQWSVRSVLAFADEFFSRMGITPVYDAFRPSFNTE